MSTSNARGDGRARKRGTKEFYNDVFDRTNGICHVCAKNLKREPRDWEADHVKPFDKEGGDEIENFLPACDRCNGLRWHNAPEVVRRILFLGVIANRSGYQKPFPADAASIRTMRAKRLRDNWYRRSKRHQPSLSRDELNEEADLLQAGFIAFENEVERRVRVGKGKSERNRWSEIVDEVRDDPTFQREWKAYGVLAERESPGKFEMER